MKKPLRTAAALALLLTGTTAAHAAPSHARAKEPDTFNGFAWSVTNSLSCALKTGKADGMIERGGSLGTQVSIDQTRTQTYAGATDPTGDTVTATAKISSSIEATVVKKSFTKVTASGSLSQTYSAAIPDSDCANLNGTIEAASGVRVPVTGKGTLAVRLGVSAAADGMVGVILTNEKTGDLQIVTAPTGSRTTASIPVRKPGTYVILVDVAANTTLPAPAVITYSMTGTYLKAGK